MKRRIVRWIGLLGFVSLLLVSVLPAMAQNLPQRPDSPEIAPQAAPTCATVSTTNIECFVVGDDGNIWQITWTQANQWIGWTEIGFPALRIDKLGGLSATARGSTIDLFAIGYDGIDYNVYQRTWNGSNWSGWTNLGGPGTVQILEVACTSVGTTSRIECFVRGDDNHLWQRSFNGTTWQAWTDLGTFPSASALGGITTTWYGLDYIVVYAAGGNGHAYRRYYELGSWSTWEDDGFPTLGSTNYLIKQIACHTKDASTIDCAFTDNDGGVWFRRWNGSWGAFTDLSYPASSSTGIALAHYEPNYAGILVMSNASDGRFYRKFRDAEATTWSGWIDQGRPPELRVFLPMAIK
ncbi:MAG: hypothetical protein KAX40_04585 [Herpetosiphon sp.]|nr:hypothetical protein [Herpetosiphon sp.]